jgi:hypothetical protein
MADEIRNESEEPTNVPQEDIRQLRKEADEIEQIPSPNVPEQIEFEVDLDQAMEELGDIASPEVVLEGNPLAPPEAGGPVSEAMEVVDTPQKSTGPLRSQPYSQRSREQKRADREARANGVSPSRVSGLNQAMTELGQVVKGSVTPDAVPVQPAQMERGEAERILLPGKEQADTLVDAYKAYMQEDKDWRISLSKLLTEMCSRLRQDRLELDSLLNLLNRDIV